MSESLKTKQKTTSTNKKPQKQTKNKQTKQKPHTQQKHKQPPPPPHLFQIMCKVVSTTRTKPSFKENRGTMMEYKRLIY